MLGKIRDRFGRGKGHPRAERTLKSTHAQGSLPRVDPHVNLNRLEAFLRLLIYFRSPASDFEGSPSRIDGVLLVGALKYHHQSVAGCFIYIAVMGVKNVQETGKIFLDNEINLLLGQGPRLYGCILQHPKTELTHRHQFCPAKANRVLSPRIFCTVAGTKGRS